MTNYGLLLTVLLPSVFALFALLCYRAPMKRLADLFLLVGSLTTLLLALMLFKQDVTLAFDSLLGGIQFRLRVDHLSSFILAAVNLFGFLVGLYTVAFMEGREQVNQFYFFYLLTVALTNGAVLSDNLIVLLFFWEGLLITLFGMIYASALQKEAWRTAIKAFTISGVADLCMMLGVALTVYLAGGETTISQINLTLSGEYGGVTGLAFILLMIGAVAKAGAMPFHSWIPDAATDAPLPFMALVPAALEKLLGIYFLARITLDLFQLDPGSWVSSVLVILGVLTLLLAVMMALVQNDFKKLLSFAAISQVGYMMLGIGTGTPIGVVGGLFHMINHALYKSTLFLTAGIVERQTGTTDLRKLGGIWRFLPFTWICFLVAGASMLGVPPFNGFFSKELIYEAALERGTLYYLCALLGSFLTAASFFKLADAAFLARGTKDPRIESYPNKEVREAPLLMLGPVMVIALICLLFGFFNEVPIEMLVLPIKPGFFTSEHVYSGFPKSSLLIGMTLLVLMLALLNHRFGSKRGGSGLDASNPIHHAPGLHGLYSYAARGVFDPYRWLLALADFFSRVVFALDRAIDFFYSRVVVGIAFAAADVLRSFHGGSHTLYVGWALFGLLAVLVFMMGGY